MQFKELFDDDRAVSPVIGVILMVAITVILAAVIGTFVLGLGDQVQQTTPQASFGFDQSTVSYEDSTGSTMTVPTVTITHESGDSIEESNLVVNVNGNPAYDVEATGTGSDEQVRTVWSSGNTVNAGSTVRVAMFDTDGTGTNNDFTTEPTIQIASGNWNPTDAEILESGDTVRVIYDNPNSDKSSTLRKFEVQ